MAVRLVPTMYPSPVFSSIGSSSVISSQIEMITRKIAQVKAGLSDLATCSPEEAAAKESDAIDILSHYHYVLTILMHAAGKRDPHIRYFDHDHSLIEVNQELSLDEINACQSLISEIEAFGLDLSRAGDLISYIGGAVDMEDVADVIEGFIAENRSFVDLLHSRAISFGLISGPECEELKSKLLTFDRLRRVVSELVRDYQLGLMNSFTTEAEEIFLSSASKSNKVGLNIIHSISEIARIQLTKLSIRSLSESDSRIKNLQEIVARIKIIDSEYRVNKSILAGSFIESYSKSGSDSDSDAATCGEEDSEGESVSLADGGGSSTRRLGLATMAGAPPYSCYPSFLQAAGSSTIRSNRYSPEEPLLHHSNHSVAPCQITAMSVHTLNSFGVCVVSDTKLNSELLGVRNSSFRDKYPIGWMGKRVPGDNDCGIIFEVRDRLSYGGDPIKVLEGLMEKLALLGTPYVALVSCQPLHLPFDPSVQSGLITALAPPDMSPSLAATFAEVGIHLVAPSKFVQSIAVPPSDTQLSASKEFDNIPIQGTFLKGQDYEIRCKTKSASPEILAAIHKAVEELMKELISLGGPAAAILSCGDRETFYADWIKFKENAGKSAGT